MRSAGGFLGWLALVAGTACGGRVLDDLSRPTFVANEYYGPGHCSDVRAVDGESQGWFSRACEGGSHDLYERNKLSAGDLATVSATYDLVATAYATALEYTNPPSCYGYTPTVGVDPDVRLERLLPGVARESLGQCYQNGALVSPWREAWALMVTLVPTEER